jgi:hypothetical protein
MVQETRRHALKLAGGSLLGALAGCSALSQGSSGEPDLSSIRVLNFDPTNRTTHVLMLDGTDPVYSASLDVPPPEYEGTAGGVEFDGFPTHVGDHVLYAWRDSQPTTEWLEFEFREYDGVCIGLVIQIGHRSSESATGETTLLKTTEASGCPNQTNEDTG